MRLCALATRKVAEGYSWWTKPTTSLKLDPKIKARVKKLAVARRRSSHWLMREAIEQYVTREEQRERFRRDAAAWAEYQATGLHARDLARLQKVSRAQEPRRGAAHHSNDPAGCLSIG
jgi:predicted transcriptional regulator